MATEAKKALRASMKERLSSLSNEEVAQQSLRAQSMIMDLPEYRRAKRVGIYLSMLTGEARTDRLVRDALSSGKAVFVPHIYSIGTEKPKRKVMDMLRLQSVDEYESLERDAWGIPKLGRQNIETRENASGMVGRVFESNGSLREINVHEGLDLIVMPAVAFDHDMNRLGHGAGFYDRFLTRFCDQSRAQRPHLVGICLTAQMLPQGEKLAMEPWDWKVDGVAVGSGEFVT